MEALDDNSREMLNELNTRAQKVLAEGDVNKICKLSAELNGICHIYMDQGSPLQNDIFKKGNKDVHILIATDTAHGSAAAKLIGSYLRQQGIIVIEYTPPGLTTANTKVFWEGIKELIGWLDETIEDYKNSKYHIMFNLTGGFKGTQGCLTTIGALYADEIVYIFQADEAELIKIPRLPINIDEEVFRCYAVEFALMAVHNVIEKRNLEIPESLVTSDDKHIMISEWGLLCWNKVKRKILAEKLLEFPFIENTDIFKTYFKDLDPQQKTKVQETLALVSGLITQDNGNTHKISGYKGLNYEQLTNKQINNHPVYTFRIDRGVRISCQHLNDKLLLRKYGKEPVINRDP